MMLGKLTPTLAARLRHAEASERVEVILELRPRHEAAEVAAQRKSRSERIAAIKEAFARDLDPVEEVVQKVGGEVLGRAWINQTVLVRVPALAVKQLSKLDGVEALDVSRHLESDAP